MIINGKDIYLRMMEDKDTNNIIKWRNTEFVYKCFIYQEPFTVESHQKWVDTMIKTGKVSQFIIHVQDSKTPVGSVYLRDIDMLSKEAEFGIFIGEVTALNKGYGKQANELICNYGFEQLGLQKIFLRVFASNKNAIQSYINSGFSINEDRVESVNIDGIKENVVFMDKFKKGSV